VPADAEASEVVDSTLAEPVPATAALGSAPHASDDVGSEFEVPDFAQWPVCCYTLGHTVLCGLVQVPAAASSAAVMDILQRRRSAQQLPSKQLPSNAWVDAMESIPVHSNQHAQPTGAASLKPHRSRGGLTVSVGAAET
jgi:hypothetical protein